MGVKDWKKLARNTFREYGGTVTGRTPYGTQYIFPDGMVLELRDNATPGSVIQQQETLAKRYGRRAESNHFHYMANRPGKPTLNLERLRASEHAKDRLALMQAQGRVEYRDVLLTLRTPERVLWSDDHESWLWVRDRIAVAVAEEEDGFVITTILWSTHDLFQQFPRPA